MVCTVKGVWVSNWKWQEQLGAEGLWPQKKSQVEVDSDAELGPVGGKIDVFKRLPWPY